MKSPSIVAAALLFCVPWPAAGQNAASSSPQEEAKITVVKIILHPAFEPRPALKYQLLPPLIDRKPGNAAVLYNRIFAERESLSGNNEMWEKIADLMGAPLVELRREETRNMIGQCQGMIDDTIRGAHFESCDWQIPIREREFWTIDLADIQQTRAYARLLAVKARQQIADGKYEDAVLTLQANYAFARHVAKGPTLINGLIGVAIAGVTSYQLRELIQQPGAPNLYWALSSLPRPFVDIRPGLEAEYDSLYLSYPELRDLEKKDYSPERWRELLEETMEKFSHLGKYMSVSVKAYSLFQILEKYPEAKRYLIERGFAAERVEAMPVAQVVLLSIMRHYDESRDNIFKWCFAPPSEAPQSIVESEKARWESMAKPQSIYSIETVLFTAFSPAMYAQLRIERDLAALQILEALRIHAAAHNNYLPDNLNDITEVPVPQDPLHRKPFFYHFDGTTATLESPNPRRTSIDGYYLKYEIQMQPNQK